MAPEINESQGKHSGDGEAICANPGLVTQPANNDKLPFGHKPDPAVGCEPANVEEGRRFVSYWHRVLLNFDLPQIVLMW